MFSASWVNQFETKDTCIKFVINNASSQGNHVKIKRRDYSSIFFCEINDNAPGFCLVLSEPYS